MFSKTRKTQLKNIYQCFKRNDFETAQKVFRSLNITDMPEHTSSQKEIKLLILKLHEFLIVGDHENVTDREDILDSFKEVFPFD
mgnify:CR=1 FL=1